MVVKDAILPLQTAIWVLLNGDTPLTDLAPIFDEVPQNLVFPYVRIGEFSTSEWRTMGDSTAGSRNGKEVAITIHIWSTDIGNEEALKIKNEIDRLLGDIITLTITGFDLNFIMTEGTDTIRETLAGGRVARHVICRYRAKVQQQP